MAGANDFFRQGPLTTAAIGVGLLALAPVVLPIVGRLSKPLVKELVKQGYLLYERTREGVAEVAELVEDAVAEARAQLELESLAQAGGAAEAPEGNGAATLASGDVPRRDA